MREKKMTIKISIFFFLFLIPVLASGEDVSKYPETTAVLRKLYKGEVIVCKTYSAFARKALEEKYDGVATLFLALRASESIHARNFKHILDGLGATAGECLSSVSKYVTRKRIVSNLYIENNFF